MADYPPPNENLQIFNPAAFSVTDGALTIEDGKKFFLQFPNAQGTENLATTNISGVLTSTNNPATGSLGFGYQSLAANTATGSFNTAFGTSTLEANTTGDENTAVGYLALVLNNGNDNTAIGVSALQSNSSGGNNTAVGVSSLLQNSTGSYNTAVGVSALFSSTASSNNTAVGYHTLLHSTASSNTAVGYQAGTALTLGTGLTAIGSNALASLTGTDATTRYNTAIGASAGQFLTTGQANTFLGYACGKGLSLATPATGSYNNCFGSGTGSSLTSGANNNLFGQGAGSIITSGGANCCLGTNAGNGMTTNVDNTCIGNQAFYTCSGSYNTMIGAGAGYSASNPVTGNYNTFIGRNTSNSVSGLNASTAIGTSAQVTASNQIKLGTASETVVCPATLQYNKVTPLYTTLPTYTSADIGFINSATITSPGTTANVIASYTAQAGVWLINVFLALTTTTTLDAIIYENAGVAQGHFIRLSVGGNDYYSGSFVTTISTGTALLRIYPFVAATTGGVQTGLSGQFVKFTRIA